MKLTLDDKAVLLGQIVEKQIESDKKTPILDFENEKTLLNRFLKTFKNEIVPNKKIEYLKKEFSSSSKDFIFFKTAIQSSRIGRKKQNEIYDEYYKAISYINSQENISDNLIYAYKRIIETEAAIDDPKKFKNIDKRINAVEIDLISLFMKEFENVKINIINGDIDVLKIKNNIFIVDFSFSNFISEKTKMEAAIIAAYAKENGIEYENIQFFLSKTLSWKTVSINDIVYNIDDVIFHLKQILQKKTKKLNKEQQEFVDTKFPLLAIAGPGSGKTETMVTRVIKEIEEVKKAIWKKKILLLTFTSKAAEEMKFRVMSKVGIIDSILTAGTFHSVFFRFLKQMKKNDIYLFKEWRIINKQEDIQILHESIKENFKDIDVSEFFETVLDISLYDFSIMIETSIYEGYTSTYDIKNKTIEMIDYSKLTKETEELLKNSIKVYFEKKKDQKVWSLADVLLYTYIFTKKSYGEKIKNETHAILIDEFQDTNKIEMMIIQNIVDKNIAIVCDPYQSIYAFLNARIDNIEQYFNWISPTLIQMKTNYRSTKNIVKLTNLIRKEIDTYAKINIGDNEIAELKSKAKFDGEKIEIIKSKRKDDAALLAIQKEIENGTDLSEIAVIIKKNKDSVGLESLLIANKIPFQKRYTNNFFEKKEIMFGINMFLFFFNQYDYNAYKAISKYIKIIKDSSGMIVKILKEDNLPVTKESIQIHMAEMRAANTRGVMSFLEEIEEYKTEGFNGFAAFIEEWDLLENFNDDEKLYFETLMDFLREVYDQMIRTKENLEELVSKMIVEKNISSNTSGKINIITAHSSKGLEWEKVIILDIGKNTFTETREDNWMLTDEQMRLLYVSVSRAKEKLYLIYNQAFATSSKDRPMDVVLKNIYNKNKDLFKVVEI